MQRQTHCDAAHTDASVIRAKMEAGRHASANTSREHGQGQSDGEADEKTDAHATQDKEAEIRGRAKGQPAASSEGESKGSEMVQAAKSIQRVTRGRLARFGLGSEQDANIVQVQMPLPGKIAAQVSPEGTQSDGL